LFTSLGIERGEVKWERGKAGKRVGREQGGYGGAGNGNARKISPNIGPFGGRGGTG